MTKAKLYFRKALEYNPQNDMFMSQILVNLANCYDTFGRVLDALEFYEEALKHAIAKNICDDYCDPDGVVEILWKNVPKDLFIHGSIVCNNCNHEYSF
ncbi:tetratricopeptide repeat protein [Candidatus Bathyarchaeota archaeon]|nr:tetratricopeptide repeat protein [Candidatus Bathyarchaeota archaeon]